jgi:aldose 1-epimerase
VTDHLFPSGEQHEFRHGSQRAVVVEVGGGLREYETADGPLLDGYDAGDRASGGRGQPLMPWPNRLRDGRYEFDGQEYELPLTETGTRTAIHGLVRWANWEAVRTEDGVRMQHRLYPQPGWPGTLELGIAYRLCDDGLIVEASATNRGWQPCPFGAGFHPYLTLGTDQVDALGLTVPAERCLEADERGLPIGQAGVAGGEYDYRRQRAIGKAQLDTCFTDLERGDDGLARVGIESDGRRATLWMDEAFSYVMVFTGDTLPESRRRRGLAVEPMTCPPDALHSGQEVIRLEPGQSWSGRWGISPG